MIIVRELRFAFRNLCRTPGFTAAGMLTFALGIGVNLAVLSVVDQMLFRPLPYGDAERLVHVHSFRSTRGPSHESFLPVLATVTLRSRVTSFRDVGYAQGNRPALDIQGLGGPLTLETASYNLLSILRVRPVAGRDFTREDALAGEPLILLSYEKWAERFGRAPEIFARAFQQRRRAFRVVGILPRDFLPPASAFGERSDGLLLDANTFESAQDAGEAGPSVVARLRDGIDISSAQAEVDVLMAQVGKDHPGSATMRSRVTVQPLRKGLFFLYSPYAWLIVAAASAVFLVACVNLATLFLARGRSREYDLAIRAALGASRGRLFVATLAESALLCLTGAAVAVCACYALFGVVLALIPSGLRGIALSPFDARLLVLTMSATLVSALVAGAMPALRASRVDILETLRRQSGSTARLRGSATLLAIEAAFGVVLVTGAAITVRNFLGLTLGHPGYEVADLYELTVPHGFREADGWYPSQRVQEILDVARSLPEVTAVGATALLPVGRAVSTRHPFWTARGSHGQMVGVSGGFFQALGTRIVAGREFSDDDVRVRALVAIVNESACLALWADCRPSEVLGRLVPTDDGARTVIGITADLKPLPGLSASPTLFVPLTAAEAPRSSSSVVLALRVAPERMLEVTTLDARLDERLGRGTVRMREVAEALPPQLQRPRFQAVLFGTVAVVALVLAATGLYAVAAFNVARRRFELAVRLSLGATSADIRRLVVRDTVRPVVFGVVAGIVAAWWAAQFLEAFVLEVRLRDPWTYGLVVTVLITTAVLAAWAPARLAGRTDPSSVLRGA